MRMTFHGVLLLWRNHSGLESSQTLGEGVGCSPDEQTMSVSVFSPTNFILTLTERSTPAGTRVYLHVDSPLKISSPCVGRVVPPPVRYCQSQTKTRRQRWPCTSDHQSAHFTRRSLVTLLKVCVPLGNKAIQKNRFVGHVPWICQDRETGWAFSCHPLDRDCSTPAGSLVN